MKNPFPLFILLLTFSHLSSAHQLSVSGDVKVVRMGQALSQDQLPSILRSGDYLLTGPQSSARIELKGNGELLVSADSIIEIKEKTQDFRQIISLLEGEVFFMADKRDQKNPQSLRLPAAMITIRDSTSALEGEAYRLRLRENEHLLEVIRGEVHHVLLDIAPTSNNL